MNHLCHGSLLQSQTSVLTGEDVNGKQLSVFSEGLFPLVTHRPSGKADKMDNMSYRISVFKINGHDLLVCAYVGIKTSNLKAPNQDKRYKRGPVQHLYIYLFFWWISLFHMTRKGYARLCERMGVKVEKMNKCSVWSSEGTRWLCLMGHIWKMS